MNNPKRIIENEHFLLKQYEILQNRLTRHGIRMWQLPFSYLAIMAAVISFVTNKESIIPNSWIFISLCVLGALILWSFTGAMLGYIRTRKNMNELELQLGMNKWTKSPISHFIPYILMILGGIVASYLAYEYLPPLAHTSISV